MFAVASMDRLRQRHAQAKQADEARNSLIEDLLQKVADMQKTMDRNAFVLVLIDGDCMNVRIRLPRLDPCGRLACIFSVSDRG